MMDEFGKKREMVKALLGMLKHSATEEVSGPAKQVTLTPKPTVSPVEKMAEGGLADTDMSASDEASRLLETKEQDADGSADAEAIANLPCPVEDEDKEKEDIQALHDENMVDEDEDNNSSAFEAFLSKKKKI
jgi:hypothetical protein